MACASSTAATRHPTEALTRGPPEPRLRAACAGSTMKRERHLGFGADAIALVIRMALAVAFPVLLAPILGTSRRAARLHTGWAGGFDPWPCIRQRFGAHHKHRTGRESDHRFCH